MEVEVNNSTQMYDEVISTLASKDAVAIAQGLTNAEIEKHNNLAHLFSLF